jgi:hypothetical protein
MSSFNQLSSRFKTSTQQGLHTLQNEFHHVTPTESNINELEAMLKRKVNSVKEDMNNRIDEIQKAITSRRPNQNDPDYARKEDQYAKLLSESVMGMDLLKAWLQNIFNRLQQIVKSIIYWISNKIKGIARHIKDAFANLFQIFF